MPGQTRFFPPFDDDDDDLIERKCHALALLGDVLDAVGERPVYPDEIGFWNAQADAVSDIEMLLAALAVEGFVAETREAYTLTERGREVLEGLTRRCSKPSAHGTRNSRTD